MNDLHEPQSDDLARYVYSETFITCRNQIEQKDSDKVKQSWVQLFVLVAQHVVKHTQFFLNKNQDHSIDEVKGNNESLDKDVIRIAWKVLVSLWRYYFSEDLLKKTLIPDQAGIELLHCLIRKEWSGQWTGQQSVQNSVQNSGQSLQYQSNAVHLLFQYGNEKLLTHLQYPHISKPILYQVVEETLQQGWQCGQWTQIVKCTLDKLRFLLQEKNIIEFESTDQLKIVLKQVVECTLHFLDTISIPISKCDYDMIMEGITEYIDLLLQNDVAMSPKPLIKNHKRRLSIANFMSLHHTDNNNSNSGPVDKSSSSSSSNSSCCTIQ